MIAGIVLGAVAGALWALALVAPRAVEPWGPLELTTVRFTAFGLVAVAGLAVLRFNPLRRLPRGDLVRACVLGLLGNVLCYLLTARAIQMAGPTPVALVFGTLPVCLAVVANMRRRTLAWGRLLPPFAVITAGIAVMTAGATRGDAGDAADGAQAIGGIAFAVLALAAWLAYAVLNSEWLTARPGITPAAWTCLTGAGTLAVLLPVLAAGLVADPGRVAPPAGASVPGLLAWGLAIGLASSWVATWCWNGAGARLPAALLGYLIVSETMFAMLYDHLLARRAPAPATLAAATMVLGGVLWGLTAARRGARGTPAAEPAGG